MARRIWGLSLAFGLALTAYACSESDSEALKLLTAEKTFSAPIALRLPQRDDSVSMADLIAGRQPPDASGCNGSLLQNVAVENADGIPGDQIQKLLLNNWARRTQLQMADNRADCIVYNDGLDKIVQTYRADLHDTSAPAADDIDIHMPFAVRENVKITYQNQYETDLPGKGHSKVLAVTCSYRLRLATGVGNVQAPGEGKCEGKWYFDNDTGQWKVVSLELTDPPLKIADEPAPSIRTFVYAKAADGGQRLVEEGLVSTIKFGRVFVAAEVRGDDPIGADTTFLQPASPVLFAYYEGAAVDVDYIYATLSQGDTQLTRCENLVLANRDGHYWCRYNPQLAPGDYRYELFLNGKSVGTYNFTVSSGY